MCFLNDRETNVCSLMAQSALATAVCWIANERRCDSDDVYDAVRGCLIGVLAHSPEIDRDDSDELESDESDSDCDEYVCDECREEFDARPCYERPARVNDSAPTASRRQAPSRRFAYPWLKPRR